MIVCRAVSWSVVTCQRGFPGASEWQTDVRMTSVNSHPCEYSKWDLTVVREGVLSVAERVGMSPKYQIVPNSEEHIIRFIKVSKPLHSDQKL